MVRVALCVSALLVAAGGLPACGTEEEPRPSEPSGPVLDETRVHTLVLEHGEEIQAASGDPEDDFDFQFLSPFDFLDHLQDTYAEAREGMSPEEIERNAFVYTVHGTHRGWIREDDLARLVALFDDDTPCLAVQKSINSRLPFGRGGVSTLGREAAFLVQGYRAERDPKVTSPHYRGYPPALDSSAIGEDQIADRPRLERDRRGPDRRDPGVVGGARQRVAHPPAAPPPALRRNALGG
jgi:hypothetical protein